jgi:hypothetical protein
LWFTWIIHDCIGWNLRIAVKLMMKELMIATIVKSKGETIPGIGRGVP